MCIRDRPERYSAERPSPARQLSMRNSRRCTWSSLSETPINRLKITRQGATYRPGWLLAVADDSLIAITPLSLPIHVPSSGGLLVSATDSEIPRARQVD